jgi:hypothetical protein
VAIFISAEDTQNIGDVSQAYSLERPPNEGVTIEYFPCVNM